MTIENISLRVAQPFIERWHYSRRVPTGKNIFFGWYINGELYAVANYGIGVNAYQSKYLSRVTGFDVTNSNLVELKRLCRKEPKLEDYPLTMFLSKCHKKLKTQGYRYVVAFSDPEENHNGGIYRAANFAYLGKTNAEYHVVDKDGVVRHRRYPYRYAQRHGCTTQEAREILGLKRIRKQPKDRWFIKIGR